MSESLAQRRALARQLMWRLGRSTRLDISLDPSTATKAYSTGHLDLLGVSVLSGGLISLTAVHCAPDRGSTASDLLWLAGTTQLLGAADSLVVKSKGGTSAARSIADRLSQTFLTPEELSGLDNVVQSRVDIDDGPLGILFDIDSSARVQTRLRELEEEFGQQIAHRSGLFWLQPDNLAFTRSIEVLSSARKKLSPGAASHVGLVLDYAWLVTVSLCRLVRHLTGPGFGELSRGVSEYFAGGASQLHQRLELAGILDQLQEQKQIPERVNISVNPPYFAQTVELVIRLLRRSDLLIEVLRVLEYESTAAFLSRRETAERAFGQSFNRVAAKLTVDVVTFLVSACNLDPKFVDSVRMLTLDSPAPPPDPAPAPEPSIPHSGATAQPALIEPTDL